MEFSFDKNTDSGLLRLSGALSVDRSGDLKQALVAAFEKAVRVTVDLEKVEKISVACLQLLCAAHSTTLGTGKAFIMVNPSGPFKKSVEAAGFVRGKPCTQTGEGRCLWVKGG